MAEEYQYWDAIMQPAVDYYIKQEKKEKALSWLGRVKVYGDIARYYLSLIQFVLILWGFMEVMKFGLVMNIVISVGGFIGLMLIVAFHVRYVLPSEYDYLNRRDRVKMETLKRVSK
jgi:hypothetical protein